MSYKQVFRIFCSLEDYNAKGIMAVIREELETEDLDNYTIISIETTDSSFCLWIGEK